MRICLLFLLWLGWHHAAIAQTPLPRFTGESVIVVDLFEEYDELRAFLQNSLDENSPQYFIVLVESTGTGPNATQEYANRLHGAWQWRIGQGQPVYPPEKCLLIVVSVGNQQIACTPSEALTKRKLTAEVLENELVPRCFIPAAKQGKLEEGLIRLVQAVEQRINAAKFPQPVAAKPVANTVPSEEAPIETKSASLLWVFWVLGALLFAALVMAALFAGVLWLIRGRMQAKAAEKLEAFKKQLAELFDRVEAIKQRHELLPYADEDFTKPMEGQTLAFYEETEQRIAQYRQRWLQAVELRQKSESLLANEPWYSSANSRRVFEQVQAAQKAFEKSSAEEECNRRLEDLEQAHERAEAQLANSKQTLSQTKELLAKIDAADLPKSPYVPAEEEILAQLEAVEEQLATDPLGAQAELKKVAEQITGWKNWMQTILSLAKRADQTADRLNQVTELVDEKRNRGFQFSERGSDPQPLLDQAQDRCEAAAHALLQGESDVATRYLDQIDALCQQVEQRVGKIEEAKTFTRTQIPARRSAIQQVQSLIETAQTDCNVLAREFARESWAELTDNIPQAQQLAAGWEESLKKIEVLCSEDQQRYLEAANTLDEVSQQQQQARQMLTAVSERLHELQRLREDSRREVDQLAGKADQVRSFLQSHSADRPRANRRFEHAEEWLQHVREDLNSARPEWTTLHGQLVQIRKEFEAAERMAREDLQLARQAEEEISDAERELQRASGFYHLGISADVGSAREQIDDAYQALRRKDYEQAISTASAARQAARYAHERARSQARQKEQRLEHERRSRRARRRLQNSNRQHFSQQPSRWSMPAVGAMASNVHSENISTASSNTWQQSTSTPSVSQNSWSDDSNGPETSQNSW